MSWGHQKFGEPEVLVTLAIKFLYFSWTGENLGRLGNDLGQTLAGGNPRIGSLRLSFSLRLQIGGYHTFLNA